MKIVAIACVRDEIDIIEAFVRHTLSLVFRLVVLDNGSTDGTLGVLRALEKEGLALDAVEDPAPGKHLSRRLTRLMREHAIGRHGADWIIPLDADEFILPPDDGPLIFEQTNQDQPMNWWWRSYVATARDDSNERNPVARILHRLVEETCPTSKRVVPASLGRQENAVIHAGNHAFSINGQEVAGVDDGRVRLAHFPVRGLGQFITKTVLGHLQNEVDVARDPALGVHHRDYFDVLKRDPDRFFSSYERLVRGYGFCSESAANLVEDPFPYRGGALRYTPAVSEAARMWPPILRYAQTLAQEYGLLRASLTVDARGALEKHASVLARYLEEIACRDRALSAQRAEIQRLQELLTATNAGWAESQAHYYRLQRSWTWKVGRLVTWPLGSLKRTFWPGSKPEALPRQRLAA
jgi:glycosyltransferase involved in cell wall biosynthesis